MKRVLSSILFLWMAVAIAHPAAAQVQPNPDSEVPVARAARKFLAPARLWKTADGKFEVQAGLLEITADAIVLKRTDNGYIARVPFEQLSREDLEFIRQLQVSMEDAKERLQALSDLLPPPIPAADLPASRPTIPKSAWPEGEIDLLIRNPDRGAEIGFEKVPRDHEDGPISGDQMASVSGYHRQGNDLANAIVVTIGSEYSPSTATKPSEPIPDHEVAASMPDSPEIRLKPANLSAEAPSSALNSISVAPPDSDADARPSVAVENRQIDEDLTGESNAAIETTANSEVDIDVSADLVGDSRVSLDESLSIQGKGTAIRFHISGRDATDAFRAGELVLSEILDSNGKPLAIKTTPPNRAGMNRAWTLIDAASRSCSATLAIPEGQVLTGIGRLKGEFKVDLVSTFKTFSLPTAGDSAATRSLKDDHGILVYVRQDSRSIVVETSGNVMDVAAIRLEGVNQEMISFSSDIRRRTGWYQFDSGEYFPANVVVNLKVVTETRRVTVPFDFENVSFAPPADE